MSAGEGAEKANVTGKDIAAALAPDKGRAPVLNKEVVALRERFKKDAGESVFKAEIVENDEDLMVNFDEMRRVLDGERKKTQSETDQKRKEVLEKRYKRLELKYDIYDKLLNNETFNTFTEAERNEFTVTLARLPGFAEAMSVATGGRLTAEQMAKVLEGRGGVAMTTAEKKVVEEMISSIAHDDRLKTRISKGLSKLTLPAEDAAKAQEIADLSDSTKNKQKVLDEISKSKKRIADIEQKYPSEQDRAQMEAAYKRANKILSGIAETFKPIDLGQQSVQDMLTQASARKTEIEGQYPAVKTNPAANVTDQFAEQRREYAEITTSIGNLNTLKTTFSTQDSADKYKDFADYEKARGALATNEPKLDKIIKDEAKLLTLESERGMFSDKYKRRMEVTLGEEVKRYWNDVVLTSAGKSAEAQASIKAEEKAAAQKEKDERVAKADELLQRFTYLSVLKYENGEAKGWDDAFLKKFVKKDMLSRSPKQLARDVLDHIIRSKGTLPRAYGKEIDAMLKEMGVGSGDPPKTTRDILNGIDPAKYQEWAERKIPEILGYARARGYYFDKLQFKPGQAEFLLRAYDEKFFENATNSQQEFAEQAAKLMGGEFKDFIKDGSLQWKDIRDKVAGKNWTEGVKKLGKYLSYLGMGYVLGGGLVFDASGTYVGLSKVGETMYNTLKAGGAVAGAVSRAGDWAINAPLEGIDTVLNGRTPGSSPIPSIRP